MLLDNLFDMLGPTGTSWTLLAILGVVGLAPVRVLLGPSCPILAQIESSRRL